MRRLLYAILFYGWLLDSDPGGVHTFALALQHADNRRYARAWLDRDVSA